MYCGVKDGVTFGWPCVLLLSYNSGMSDQEEKSNPYETPKNDSHLSVPDKQVGGSGVSFGGFRFRFDGTLEWIVLIALMAVVIYLLIPLVRR